MLSGASHTVRRSLLELLAALGLGLVLAVVWTWPLLPSLGTALPYDPVAAGPVGSDMHIWTWNFWWAGQVAAGVEAPFHSDAIFLPVGHSLVFHTHSFFWGLLTLPVQWAFGVPAAVGLALLLLPASAFAAAWALARDLGTSRAGACVTAFGWAFAPYFLQKGLEHLAFVATPWPPLLVLFLLRWMAAPAGTGWRPALGAGVVVGLGLLSGSLVGMYLVVLGGLVVLVAPKAAEGVEHRTAPGRLALLDGPALLLFLGSAVVLAWPLLSELRAESASLARAAASGAAAGEALLGREVGVRTALVDFLRLAPLHPLGTPPADAPPGWNEVSSLHLSAALLVLGALALRGARHLRGWVVLFLVGFLLTWDPVVAEADGGLFSSLYRRLPGLDALRIPARSWPLALLPLAVLGGLGWDRLRASSRPTAAVLALVLVAESWTRSLPLMDVTPPPAVEVLAATDRRPADGVLTLPVQPGASRAMTWQTRHGRPVVFSYVARANPRATLLWMHAAPDLFAVMVPRVTPAGAVQVPDPRALAIDLAGLGVGDVLVDVEGLGAGAPALLGLLGELLDGMPGWERQEVEGPVAWWRRVA